MGSIERRGLPPIGTRGASISQEDARRFAMDLLDNYFSGPDAYFADGPQKNPYNPDLNALNGIFDPEAPLKKNTLVHKLNDLQSRVVDQSQRAYVQSLIDGMIEFRKTFGKRLVYEHEVKPFQNSPAIMPDDQRNFDFKREIPDYQSRFPKFQPCAVRPILSIVASTRCWSGTPA
ncbi:hypothetical protein FJW07_06625 [Mesorhizobium sp. B3-1-9]|uniref:hypothetical protein n=1 Tax=unclassified Mesorhizobium TaxID=325217 RepID=UPI00112BBEFF|nr:MULTISPECIES: hypothetical protein [unclassified Mesorhizobium]TPI40939.1 hypothetical protein FJW07_06625 [Mesorhizobium sp. B3-1-9]TPJ31995.1 hypothetical protein FJ418_21105 [Mesorhizobium sp. B2-8-3]